jgi:hypothetical protein
MKKYLLFMMGDFTGRENVIRDVADCISPIADSPSVKFLFGDYNVIIHFWSNVNFEELREFLSFSISSAAPQYFIMEYTDNMSVVLPRTLFEHLFDLDKKDTDVDLNTRNFGLQKTGLGMTAKELDEQFDEEIDEKIFEEIMNKAGFKKPTVDEILDKINEFGIESLTPLEQSVLKSQE